MNRVLKTFVCLVFGAFLFNSCVSNEESEGVKALREAKAREINADAHNQEIANMQAELAYLKSQATHDLEIQILIAEKQAALINAQLDHYIAEAKVPNDKLLAYKDELDEIRGKISTINTELYGNNGTPGGYTVQLATINNTIAANKKLIEDLDTDDDAAQIATLKAQNTALTAQKAQIEALIASKAKEIAALQKRLDTLIEEIGKF